jgi:hypothetical protein
MTLIHCTQKLLKELGGPHLQSPDSSPDTNGLGNWYANLLRIDRRKCLLFTNEKTLYTFLIPKVLKEHLKNIKNEFLNHLILNLQYEEIGLDAVNRVGQEYQEIGFAKTNNRVVLGSMNDFIYQAEGYIEVQGGIDRANILVVNHKVNQSPMSMLQYERPVDVLKKVLRTSANSIS